MDCDIKGIRKLVKRIRDGNSPKVEGGKFEDVYRDPALTGFGIRVLHTGAASWFVQYKRHGRQGKVTIGDVRVLDREQAVEAARDVLAKIQLRILDPQAAKREAMRANKITFESLVPLFLKAKEKIRASSYKVYRRHLTGYYFKPLHKLPIDEITPSQISARLDAIGGESGSQAAWSTYITMSVVFKWAMKTHKLPEGHRNPMGAVDQPPRNEPRARVLDNDEIRLIWKTCEDWGAATEELKRQGRITRHLGHRTAVDVPRVVRLLFCTGCRAQEIGGLQWSEVYLPPEGAGEICISRNRVKSGKQLGDLCNPLTDVATDILRSTPKRQGNTFVFGTVPGKPLDLSIANQLVDKRIARAGQPPSPIGSNRWPIEKEQPVRDLLAAGIPITRICQELHVHQRTVWQIRDRVAAGIPVAERKENPKLEHWTIHDIRRTVRTKLAELRVPDHIAARLLGHTRAKDIGQTKVEQGYDRHEYWVEKRDALNRWQDHLRAIIDGTAEKVVRPHFHFGRRPA
jgi:integrase